MRIEMHLRASVSDLEQDGCRLQSDVVALRLVDLWGDCESGAHACTQRHHGHVDEECEE